MSASKHNVKYHTYHLVYKNTGEVMAECSFDHKKTADFFARPLYRLTIDGITVMFCGDAVTFRFDAPENEQNGERLVDFMQKFIAENRGWALLDSRGVDIAAMPKEDSMEFLNKTRNRGVLWVGFTTKSD